MFLKDNPVVGPYENAWIPMTHVEALAKYRRFLAHRYEGPIADKMREMYESALLLLEATQ